MVSMNELKQDMIIGMGYIGLDSGRLYRMRRGPKLIDAVASGSAIIINDATEGRPFRGLRVFGWTEQVRTSGKNLFDINSLKKYEVDNNDLKASVDNEKIVLEGKGVKTSEAVFFCFNKTADLLKLNPGKYALSFKSNMPMGTVHESKTVEAFAIIKKTDGSSTFSSTGLKGYTVFEILDGDTVYFRFDINNGTMTAEFYDIQLEYGSSATAYEPYTGGAPSPSPEYPQEIVSAGENGSVEVKVTGKNLLTGRLYYIDYSMGAGFIKNENEVSLPYAPKSETSGIGYVIPCAPEKHYAFSVTNPNENAVVAISEYKTLEDAKNKENAIGFVVPSSASPYKSVYTSKGNGVLVCWIAGKWTDGKTTIHECTESELLQLEIGSEATTYEPPRIPQSLTLATPNGLPGIPVTKDGNYTDADGQQWICDEIDLERGKYVQRVVIENISGGWSLKETSDRPGRFIRTGLSNKYANGGIIALCSIASWKSWGSSNGDDRYVFALSMTTFYISPPSDISMTADELNAKLNALKDPVVVLGQLATPIERDLTPEEIAAYKALRTYGPTTVISNDAEAGMEVTYVADRKEN